MCNHYRNNPDQIPLWREYAGFDVRQPNEEFATDVYPKRMGMVVRKDDGIVRSDVMAWGVPCDVRGASGKMLEKRVTNVRKLSSNFWKSMLANPAQRCLVPFSTFAEPKIGHGREEWWFNVLDQPMAAFAGIWRQCKYGPAFAFLTCEPNELLEPLHPKAMPVILDPNQYEEWLSTDFVGACAMSKPFPSIRMTVQ
ncbi:SOS response-associated peptidase family protein [Sphingobium bisphenolivorans]|uniref:SOS response-associated peptidase family protein n=1 Tax=Sphingobium bisphenolivorans TaxID=1335760 RepID=UPI0003B3508D|nr:SOS response-associated peptidase family protein [Sphingobium bisphenolivorans]